MYEKLWTHMAQMATIVLTIVGQYFHKYALLVCSQNCQNKYSRTMDIYYIDKYKLLIPTHYRDTHISFIIITLRPDASLTN